MEGVRKRNYFFWGGMVFLLLLTSFILRNFLFNLSSPIDFTYDDSSLVYFILHHYAQVFTNGEWNHILTLPMFYGFNNSLLFYDTYLLSGIVVVPLYFLTHSIILSTNILVFLAIIFSAISMYVFSNYLTKLPLVSILATIIFIFNPYVFSHFPNHINLISIGWIPLIFFSFEKFLSQRKERYILLFFLCLICQLTSSSLYYGAYLSLILPIYCLLRLIQTKTSRAFFLNKSFAIGATLFIILTVGLGMLYFQTLSSQQHLREGQIVSNSPTLFYLFTDPSTQTPPVYNSIEKTYFISPVAITLLLLSFLAIWMWGIKQEKKYYFLILSLLFLCILVSFGPQIMISDQLSIPGIYNIVSSINPMFHLLRVPTRIAVFIFFFLSVAIVFGMKVSSKHISRKIGFGSIVVFIFLLILPFLNLPVYFTHITNEEKYFFSIVNTQKNIHVIADYPLVSTAQLPDGSLANFYTAQHYLLWASVLHTKVLFNGDNGFAPPLYRQRATLINTLFPTKYSLEALKKYGVDGVVIEKEELFVPGSYEIILRELKMNGAKLIVSTPNYAFFDITNIK